jgi:hypothetical protein
MSSVDPGTSKSADKDGFFSGRSSRDFRDDAKLKALDMLICFFLLLLMQGLAWVAP